MSGPSLAKRQDAVKPDVRRESRRTQAGDAVSELVVHVFQLNGLLSAAGDQMAQPAGQTSARWRVLAAIEEAPLTVPQIARAWWLSRQSVQRVADLVVLDSLAVYEDNPGHRRSKLLRITPRGRAALRTIRWAQRSWADQLGAEIREADLQTTNATLAHLVDVMASRGPNI